MIYLLLISCFSRHRHFYANIINIALALAEEIDTQGKGSHCVMIDQEVVLSNKALRKSKSQCMPRISFTSSVGQCPSSRPGYSFDL